MQFIHIADSGYAHLVNEDGSSTLKTLQRLVDGLVDTVEADPVALGFNATVWVNDEGLYRRDFGINLIASFITGRQLVGPAVITTVDSDGDTCGLTAAQIKMLTDDGLFIDTNDGKGYTADQVAALLWDTSPA